MNTNARALSAKSFTCIAAAAAIAVLSGPAQADSQDVTVKISVSTSDLDVAEPTGAREAYRRLGAAAHTACSSGNRVGLQAPPSYVGCYQAALAGAVRSANRPQLTIIYLATHTAGDAATYGIEVPVRVAAK